MKAKKGNSITLLIRRQGSAKKIILKNVQSGVNKYIISLLPSTTIYTIYYIPSRQFSSQSVQVVHRFSRNTRFSRESVFLSCFPGLCRSRNTKDTIHTHILTSAKLCERTINPSTSFLIAISNTSHSTITIYDKHHQHVRHQIQHVHHYIRNHSTLTINTSLPLIIPNYHRHHDHHPPHIVTHHDQHPTKRPPRTNEVVHASHADADAAGLGSPVPMLFTNDLNDLLGVLLLHVSHQQVRLDADVAHHHHHLGRAKDTNTYAQNTPTPPREQSFHFIEISV